MRRTAMTPTSRRWSTLRRQSPGRPAARRRLVPAAAAAALAAARSAAPAASAASRDTPPPGATRRTCGTPPPCAPRWSVRFLLFPPAFVPSCCIRVPKVASTSLFHFSNCICFGNTNCRLLPPTSKAVLWRCLVWSESRPACVHTALPLTVVRQKPGAGGEAISNLCVLPG